MSETRRYNENNGNGDGWKSRKFVSSEGSAFAMMVYSGVAKSQSWINEATLITLMIAGLIAIFAYSGINLAEKLGGVGNLIFPNRQKNASS